MTKIRKRNRMPCLSELGLKNPHPLVKKTLEEFSRARTDKYGIIEQKWLRDSLNLRVSWESLPRALKITDSLIKRFESAGASVSIAPYFSQKTTAVIFKGKEIPIKIYEQTVADRSIKTDPMPGDERQICRPTGELMLVIAEYMNQPVVRDLPGDPIEGKQNVFVEKVLKRIEEKIEAGRANREQEFIRKKEEEARLREQNQVEKLDRLINQWQRAATIRSFVEAARGKLMVDGPPGNPQQMEFLDWAIGYADKIDPLVN